MRERGSFCSGRTGKRVAGAGGVWATRNSPLPSAIIDGIHEGLRHSHAQDHGP
jgi:hypothetical protein